MATCSSILFSQLMYLWPCWVFGAVGLFSSCCVQASHCGGVSVAERRLQGAGAQELPLLGSRAQVVVHDPRHVGSSWIRD